MNSIDSSIVIEAARKGHQSEHQVEEARVNISDSNVEERSPSTILMEEMMGIDDRKGWENYSVLNHKLDWNLLPLMMLANLIAYINKSNLTYARMLNLEVDLDLSPTQYSWCWSIFFFGYMLLSIPSNLILKLVSPSNILGCVTLCSGILMLIMVGTSSFVYLLICRLLLGALESAVLPNCIFILSMWYTPREQGIRLAIIFGAISIASIFSSLLPYILPTNYRIFSGWQYLFMIEGMFPLALGLVILFKFPNHPCTNNQSRFDGNAQEEVEEYTFLDKTLSTQLKMKLSSNGIDLSSLKSINWLKIMELLCDFNFYLFLLTSFGILCVWNGLSLIMPILLYNMDIDTFHANLLLIPNFLIGLVCSLITAYHSDYKLQRGPYLIGWTAISNIGLIISLVNIDATLTYVCLSVSYTGIICSIPILFSWVNNYAIGSTTRSAILSAMTIFMGNLGGSVGSQLFLANEREVNYRRSFLVCLACLATSLVCGLLLRWRILFMAKRVPKVDRKFNLNREFIA